MSDSSTGGYLLPTTPPPLDDTSLMDFLHSVIEGVTALPPTLIRQSWQRNPPPVPSNGVDWVSYGITRKKHTPYPYMAMNENEMYEYQMQEDLDVYCIFYGANCMSYASLLRDSMYIPQNSESMNSVGIALKGFGEIDHVPEIPTLNYFDRCDIVMNLVREIRREYPVLSFLSVVGSLNANTNTEIYTNDFEVQ